MKKIILTMAVIATLASCKKGEQTIREPEVQPLSQDIKLSVSGASLEAVPSYTPSEKYNFLGYGYDVTDKFDDAESVRANVVDIASYAASLSTRFDFNRSTEGSFDQVYGKDAVDFAQKLSNSFDETKGLGVFGNTLDKAFPKTSINDKKYVYGYYSYWFIRKTIKFYYDQSINRFLSASFKSDIDLLGPEALVKKYGTHVMAGIKVGRKLDVLYQAESLGGDRTSVIKEGLRYAMKRTFGLPTSELDAVKLGDLNANSSAKIYYKSVGGDESKLKIQTKGDRVVLDITDWISSLTENNVRFMGPQGKIVPLYSFIDDNVKKAEVKSYIEKYMNERQVKLIN